MSVTDILKRKADSWLQLVVMEGGPCAALMCMRERHTQAQRRPVRVYSRYCQLVPVPLPWIEIRLMLPSCLLPCPERRSFIQTRFCACFQVSFFLSFIFSLTNSIYWRNIYKNDERQNSTVSSKGYIILKITRKNALSVQVSNSP